MAGLIDQPVSPHEILGAEGPFARTQTGFMPRAGQQMMADAVADCLARQETLIVEAGTGVGKTYAYLVPLLTAGGKSLVSTGTKNLQDQLFKRDLPAVMETLARGITVALLKGRGNYLCRYRFELARQDAALVATHGGLLKRLAKFDATTRDGDLTTVPGLVDAVGVRFRVSSTVDNCLGQKCPFFDDCHLVEARRRAHEADLVVVNHHLLFADMALKQDGFGEVLPAVDALILDEAHLVPEIASQFFSQSFNTRQVRDLLRDAEAEAGAVSGALQPLLARSEVLENALRHFLVDSAELPERGATQSVLPGRLGETWTGLGEALAEFAEHLQAQGERSEGLAAVAGRGLALLAGHVECTRSDVEENIYWYERSERELTFHATPLNVADALAEFRASYEAAWVLTSATLSVGGDFTHFVEQTGLNDATTLSCESPFDYRHKALLYVPEGLPLPRHEQHTQALVDAVRPLLTASGGRAFLLFTSHRARRRAAELLAGDGYPLFVQGDQPPLDLVEDFKASGNGVLLGSASFWQGVDVPGSALSMVVIDKLPFQPPDDPVLQARVRQLEARGEAAFHRLQLPAAVIRLKQGAGRLIRTLSDRGVLVIGDPRLASKGYAHAFVDSLPPMPRTRRAERAKAFFSTDAQDGAAS